jgi:single-strand DNA-binding protein
MQINHCCQLLKMVGMPVAAVWLHLILFRLEFVLNLRSVRRLRRFINLKNKYMRGVNRVMLIGNLGKDPDVQSLEGNIAVAKFPLATTETFKDRSGKLVSQTEWHTVVLWRGLAELAQKFLHKSSLVYIEGRLRTRSWEDKDGNRKFATEVVGDNLIMLDKRADTPHPPSNGIEGGEGNAGPDLTTPGDISENLPY